MTEQRKVFVRCRMPADHGTWEVHARVERFVEPALLLALCEGPAHGYELAETIEEIAPGHRVDLGNLYRLLRSLEKEALVTSEWRDDLPGRAKRVYELTDEGRQVLHTWAESVRQTHDHLAAFLERYEKARGG